MNKFPFFNVSIILIVFCLALSPEAIFSQGIVVTEETGTATPAASSIMDVRSTTKGLLIPRMTAEQRLAVVNPANGLLVYDLTENQFFYYDEAAISWVKAVGPQGPQGFLSPGTAIGNVPYWNGTQWVLSSNNLYHNGTRVGIGTDNPVGKLDVRLADGTDYINVQRTSAGFGPILDLFGYSTTHRLRLEYLSTSVYNFQTDGTNRHISFNPSGNFGIGLGTLAATQKLDVNGALRLRGHLFDYNNSSGTAGQVLTRAASGLVWANPAGNVNGTGTIGRLAYWSSASNISALPFMNYNTTNQFVEVTSKAVANDDDPIFEVRNKDGMIVFGVYQTGVRIYVDDSQAKTARGGFAVGGFTTQKDEKAGVDYLRVTPDSVRIYIDNTDSPKTARGGFAVGGFTTQKGMQELFRVTPDSTRIYINDKPSAPKTARGGFAVGGFTTQKGTSDNFFNIETSNTYLINPSEPRILWYPLKNAFLAGQVKILDVNDVGLNSMAIGFEAKAKGNRSQAMGYLTEALGDNSTAIGKQAKAQANNSFAFGDGATASNADAYAFGALAIASGLGSYAIGSEGRDSLGVGNSVFTQATGNYSIAIGQGAEASGLRSLSIGINSKATQSASFAVGMDAKAEADNSYAIGRAAQATGQFSYAIGPWSVASGENSSSLFGGRALGSNSMAIGSYVFAHAPSSIAIAAYDGYHETHANGVGSVAIGYNYTSGLFSFAIGYLSSAAGESSLAAGNESIAIGKYSNALGTFRARSHGDYSTAMGAETHARSGYETVIGRFNADYTPVSASGWNTNDRLFVIGNGVSEAGRSNAVTVLKNGNVGIGISNPTRRLSVSDEILIAGYYSASLLMNSYDAYISLLSNGNLYFNTSTNNTRMIIKGTNGNVGIGNNNPLAALHLSLADNASFFRIDRVSAGFGPIMDLYGYSNTHRLRLEYNSGGNYNFETDGTNNHINFNPSGNVGVGIQSPTAKLHVQSTSSITSPQLLLRDGSASGYARLNFQNTSGAKYWAVAGTTNNTNDASSYLNFYYSEVGDILRIRGTGNVGIGRAPTTNRLEVNGEASKTTAGSWIANSDERIKTQISDIDNALELIMSVRPVKFKYTQEWIDKNPSIKNHFYYNFIAQEYKDVFPESVQSSGEFIDGDNNEILQIDSYNAQIVSIKAVQELVSKVESLESENAELKQRLERLERIILEK